MKYCSSCLMPETRPRITFNEKGVCNACQWAEEKRTIVDWEKRWQQLLEICERNKKRNPKGFDCIVPVSGGKDSSYVAYKMKNELGMHPLTITVQPPLPFEIGNENLENFINCGYDHLRITPNPEVGRKLSKICFIEYGQPLMAWIIAVQTVTFRISVLFNIPLIMFGEEGEVEYGGSSALKDVPFYDVEFSIKVYLSGIDPRQFAKEFSEKELYWWLYPSEEELRKVNLEIAHWSYFENWDSYLHYLIAKEKCGLKEMEQRCIGTYNNFAQTDTCLYDLHCYLMYLKFGFGRCTQDVGIDIRRGALTREQGLNLVKAYDGEYPEPFIEKYLEYFRMTKEEFDAVLDKFANKNLFRKEKGRWIPTFEPH